MLINASLSVRSGRYDIIHILVSSFISSIRLSTVNSAYLGTLKYVTDTISRFFFCRHDVQVEPTRAVVIARKKVSYPTEYKQSSPIV